MVFSQIQLFGQDFQWVRQIKGITHDYDDFANGQAVDDNGNNYIIGNTASLLFDLDPTLAGTDIIDNTLINHTFRGNYLIKTDVDGNYSWGLTFDSYNGNDHALDVKIGTDGNIYALLSLEQLNTNLNVIEGFIKIIKISPNGAFISTTSIKQNYGYNSNMYPYSFDLDSQNNIFLSGWFVGNISVNDYPNLSLNNGNGIGNYLLKINNNGNLDWVKQFNISDNSDNKLIVRPDGNVNLIIKNSSNYTLYNIDNNTNSIIWQKEFINQTPFTFHVSNNSIVILGDKNYYDTVDVDPSPNITNVSGNCIFIIFLNLDGSFLDVKQFLKPSSGNVSFSAVTTDVSSNYYFAGNFNDTVDFDPSINNNNITAGYFGDAFYLKLDSNRNFESIIKFGQELPLNSPYNICETLLIKKIKVVNNNNYLVGEFNRVCDFDPSANSQSSLNSINSSTYNYDGFIVKLGPCNTAIPVGNNNQTFCSSQNPTITDLLPNSSSIKWYNSATSTSQLSNTTPLLDGQTYYASRQIGSCPESQRLGVTVAINQSPPAPISTNQTFCENINATISNLIVTGQNIKWYTSLIDTNSLPTNTILQTNTNYYATQTVNGCESNKALINVTINSVSLPSLTSPQTFCVQQNAEINSIVIYGQNIKWYDASTGGNLLSNTSSLINGHIYYASQTTNNCESLRIPVLINIQNTPAPTGTTIQTFCSTQNPTLNDIVVNGSNLNWYNSNSSTIVIQNTTQLVNGITYYATQVLNNCESINRLAITVNLISNLNANDYSETICDNLNDGFEIVNLSSYHTNLISNTSNYTFEYYSSLLGATNQTITDLISTISNYNLTTGNHSFFVRITSTNGCHQIVKLNISLVSKPIISINDIAPICENRNITIHAGLGFDSYIWSTGSTLESIIITHPGNYSVTVTKSYGTTICSSTKNFAVVLSNVATITNIKTQDWTDNENIITVNISSNSSGNYEFSIDGINYQDSNVFSGLIGGAYTVYVRDKNGCGLAKDEIFLLMYPKFFTPNGDGYNDTWAIKFSHIEPNLKVAIFDRYGKLLNKLNNANSWDGKYNGNELPSTDYWFVVTRENGKEYRGHFTMKR